MVPRIFSISFMKSGILGSLSRLIDIFQVGYLLVPVSLQGNVVGLVPNSSLIWLEKIRVPFCGLLVLLTKEFKMGANKMAQWVKCLLHKSKDPISTHRIHIKVEGGNFYTCHSTCMVCRHPHITTHTLKKWNLIKGFKNYLCGELKDHFISFWEETTWMPV